MSKWGALRAMLRGNDLGDVALKKVARVFLPVMPIIAGRNARTTFLLP